MRILVVTQLFWPEEGGASVVLRELGHAWTRAGHSVTVLTTRSHPSFPARERMGSVEVERLPLLRVRLLGTLHFMARLRLWLARRIAAYDVVCVSMLKYAAGAILLGHRPGGLPVILKTEGGGSTGDVVWQETAPFGARVRRLCRRADALVAISPEIERELQGAGYARERVHLIPNGVPVPPVAWDRAGTAAHRRELALPERTTLCYTGRLRTQKGIEDLVRALPAIERSIGPCQLLLVGDGPDRDRLARIAAECGVAPQVAFAGMVPDVEPYLRASDLYVLPSYVEGLSIALLEALALGLPALASDIEANRGIADASVLSLFATRSPQDLARAAVARLSHPDLSAAAAATGRYQASDRYGVDAVAARYVALFRELRGRIASRAHPGIAVPSAGD